MNRRELLQRASAGLLSPLGAQPATGRIRVGLLGTRHSHTTGKLKAMKESPDYEVVAVCENDRPAHERAAKNPLFEGLRWVSEDELLGDSSLGLIVVECCGDFWNHCHLRAEIRTRPLAIP